MVGERHLWQKVILLDSYERAKARIPGGVNSPVRAWKGVGGGAAVHRARSRRPCL